MATYGIAAPHGPDVDGRHPSMIHPVFDMNQDQKEMFDQLLKPDDSYTKDGVYWADVPTFTRMFGMHGLGECSRHFIMITC